jgi:hypothetical protein
MSSEERTGSDQIDQPLRKTIPPLLADTDSRFHERPPRTKYGGTSCRKRECRGVRETSHYV